MEVMDGLDMKPRQGMEVEERELETGGPQIFFLFGWLVINACIWWDDKLNIHLSIQGDYVTSKVGLTCLLKTKGDD